MVGTKINTSPHMNTVVIVLWVTRSFWSTGKEVITDMGFCIPKVLFVNEEDEVL